MGFQFLKTAAVLSKVCTTLFRLPCPLQQTVNLLTTEHLSQQLIVFGFFPQSVIISGQLLVLTFKPFIAMVQTGICLIEPLVIVNRLKAPHHKRFNEGFQPLN